MRTSSQFLLTFLLNASWQIALITALASLSSWLMRDSPARFRHWIWVAALLLSVLIPATTFSQFKLSSFADLLQSSPTNQQKISPLAAEDFQVAAPEVSFIDDDTFTLNRSVALMLLALYAVVLCYGVLRLVHALYLTRKLRFSSIDPGKDKRIDALVEKCSISISGMPQTANIRVSVAVPVPMTIGVLNPLIILPELLLGEGNEELLTSAIGHELVHIRRRDYVLNFIYELLYLPLSFHPAAALIRRRIRQTRELSCDELVAERILKPEVYARSLVKLASSAPALHRLSVITTVGIADADILEARVMSLLRKPSTDSRRKRVFLIACSILLLVPCLAAAAFAMRFDLASAERSVAQDPAVQERELKEKREAAEVRERSMSSEDEFKERLKNDPKFREEVERKREIEFKMRAARQNALLNLARINMDQAIQIATGQYPGKVLQCSLDAENWKEPGVLDSDGRVFYRVVLISSEDAQSGGATHVWVNAIDGAILKTEKELPRKRKPE